MCILSANIRKLRIFVSVHVQQPLCMFLSIVDRPYPGPFVMYTDGPGYKWSTLGANSPGYEWFKVQTVQGTNSLRYE